MCGRCIFDIPFPRTGLDGRRRTGPGDWGLDSVAIYDQNDDGYGEGTADADDFQEAADDYDHDIGVDWQIDALRKLRDLKKSGVNITELHVFDHGYSGFQELGPGVGVTFRAWQAIGKLMGSGGKIYLWGCNVGEGKLGGDYLQRIANVSGQEVSAQTGRVHYGNWLNSPILRNLTRKDHWTYSNSKTVTKHPQPPKPKPTTQKKK